MPVEATFDPGALFQILRGTPRLTDDEVAQALTKHNTLERGVNQTVTANTVKMARRRYRPQLEAMGVHRRNGEAQLVSELKARTGYKTLPAEQNARSRILANLRLLSRQEAGRAIPVYEHGRLETWVDSMRSRRYVVDIMDGGVPYIRPAMGGTHGELTPEGELHPGGAGLLASGK